jgi:hypothetical protein
VSIAPRTRALLRAGFFVPLLCSLVAAPAFAQGKGNGKGKSKPGGGPVTSGSAASSAANDAASAGGLAIRQFGAWLDDASLLARGSGSTSISFGHYGSLAGTQTDFPVVDAGFGLSKRVQIGVTVPYYHARFLDGTTIGGLGDVFLSSKVLLREATGKRPLGLALSPVVEISDNPLPGYDSFAWGLPVSIETQLAGYRVFGSTGYFSRGAIFAAAAVEVPVGERVVTIGGLTLMRSVNESLAADALGLSKARADVTASAAYFVSPSIALFGGTGRTLGNRDGTGTTFMLTAGISVNMVRGGRR